MISLTPLLAQTAAAQTAFAADTNNAPEYTYTAVFYPGNQGTFSGSAVPVVVRNNAITADVQTTVAADKITVTGLKLKDQITLDAAATGNVNLINEKYYVKGIRESGRDNSTVSLPSFTVSGDSDYVVAYAIKGNTVSYTVNYTDASGASLAASRTYYGNVGDRPVVAYQYIEGYQPQSYNITSTLKENEADNIFTFVYTPTPVTTTETTVTTTTTTGAATAGTAGTAGTGTAAGTAGTEAAAGTEGTTTIEENQTPQALTDLEQGDVPKSDGSDAGITDSGTTATATVNRTPLYIGIGIAIAAAALIIVFLLMLKKRRASH